MYLENDAVREEHVVDEPFVRQVCDCPMASCEATLFRHKRYFISVHLYDFHIYLYK